MPKPLTELELFFHLVQITHARNHTREGYGGAKMPALLDCAMWSIAANSLTKIQPGAEMQVSRYSVEHLITPALVMGFFALPGLTSATGIALLMNGHMRGLAAIAPILLIGYTFWNTRNDWSWPDPLLKNVTISWLVGLPLGIAAGGIGYLFQRFMG